MARALPKRNAKGQFVKKSKSKKAKKSKKSKKKSTRRRK